MGGTSTDVCLVLDGAPAPAAQRSVGGYPVRFPSLDIHTIGAGGGSIAGLDPGGALAGRARAAPAPSRARPATAAAASTPPSPTPTSSPAASPPGTSFGGLALDADAARAALATAGVTADGVIQVVDAAMERALRAVSVERGVDPRRLALVAFGGAGPLHACALAEALDMAAVIVPARAGVLSAVGLLTSPAAARPRALVADARRPHGPRRRAGRAGRARCRAWSVAGATTVDRRSTAATRARATRSPCRTVADFHEAHRLRNGFARPEAAGRGDRPARHGHASRQASALTDLPAPERPSAVGPVALAEPDCTIWIPAGWTAEPGAAGALVLRRDRS